MNARENEVCSLMDDIRSAVEHLDKQNMPKGPKPVVYPARVYDFYAKLCEENGVPVPSHFVRASPMPIERKGEQ